MSISSWFEKRKYKYLGFLDGTVAYAKFWGFPAVEKRAAVHFFENGNGKRKVTGDSAMIELPEIVAWLNGRELDASYKAALKGTGNNK